MYATRYATEQQSAASKAIDDEMDLLNNRIILACRKIPECPEELSDIPFGHGHKCAELSEAAYLRDRWVHGIYYEFVSQILFSYLHADEEFINTSKRCLFRAAGRLFIHGYQFRLVPVFDVILILVTWMHPCHPSLDKVAKACEHFIRYIDRLPVPVEDMWWRDLSNATFPAESVRFSSMTQISLNNGYLYTVGRL